MRREPTHLDVQHPDVVGPLGVVLHQTGHPAAPLGPGEAPVGGVDLDHGGAQGLGHTTHNTWSPGHSLLLGIPAAAHYNQ